MTTYGQKYGCIGNCYCGNDNDNKILVAPIFGMTMLTTTMNEKNHYKYCCTPPIQPQLLISSHTSSSLKEG